MATSTTPRTNLRQSWERLIRTSPRLIAARTGEQISKLSWAKKVYTFEALPEAFQPLASDLMLDKQAFPIKVETLQIHELCPQQPATRRTGGTI